MESGAIARAGTFDMPLAETMYDPAKPDKNVLLLQVFLAREEQWPDFEKPQLVVGLENK